MKISIRWQRILIISGLVLMLIGALDPLEGSVVILAGSLVIAVAGFVGKIKRWKLLAAAFALVSIGVAVLFGMSAMGGIGGRTGRSLWWAILILPYPAGWIMGLAGAVLGLKEFKKEGGG